MPSAKDLQYMRLCLAGATIFARCSKRQYFAIIVGSNGRIVSTGYNGVPSGMTHCTDGGCPRVAEGSANGSSYDNCYSTHAEGNATLYSSPADRAGGTIYVNGPPCFGCAKTIANSGIRRVVYIPDEAYADWPRINKFLAQAGVKTVPVTPDASSSSPPETVKATVLEDLHPWWTEETVDPDPPTDAVYRVSWDAGLETYWLRTASGSAGQFWKKVSKIPEGGRIVRYDNFPVSGNLVAEPLTDSD